MSFSQYTFHKQADGFAIEVSLENTDLIRLPIYRNSISSIAVKGDQIIGGTKANEGLSPFIFSASLSRREMNSVKDLSEDIPNQRGIVSGFVKGPGNKLYAGTMPDKINDTLASGHLLEVSLNGKGISIKDLGVPVRNEGVFALTGDQSGSVLYGISHPSGIFFVHDLRSGKTQTFDDLAIMPREARKFHEFTVLPEDYLSRSLIVDKRGMVYGSKAINKLFSFNPKTGKFTILTDELPEVWGRNVLGRADALVQGPNGFIYGSNSGDGQLFQLDPVSKKIKNLGKPVMINRIRGLVYGADKKLYGIAGAPPGYAHLFSYDSDEGFKDFGNPQFTMRAPGIAQGIPWRGFNLGSVTASEDGKWIIMGEDESLSQILVFPID